MGGVFFAPSPRHFEYVPLRLKAYQLKLFPMHVDDAIVVGDMFSVLCSNLILPVGYAD